MNLIQCTKSDNFNEVKRLLQNGVNVNAVDGDGRTALSLAAEMGHVECAVVLLDANADVNKVNNAGLTPLHDASVNDHVEFVRVRRLCVV